MKTTIFVLVLLFVCAFVGGLEVSFSPFYVRLNNWESLVGYILVFLAFLFMNLGAYRNGYELGWKRGSEYVIEYMKKLSEQKKTEQSNEHVSPGAEI